MDNEYKIRIKTMDFSTIGKDIPLYKESVNRKGYINFGDNNLLPNYYLSLIDRSPLHNAVINRKASMIGGNGFIKENLTIEALNFIKNITNSDDLDEILYKISMDLEVFGAFALNIIWSKDRTKIAEINYINPQSIRIAIPDPKYPNVERYLVSRDWSATSRTLNEPVLYSGFNTRDKSNASQILYCKNYQAGNYFYGVPEYISGARFIEMQFEISQFHLSNIKNGFAPSFFLNFPTGVPSDEEMNFVNKQLMRELGGSIGTGRPFITYSENKETAPEITPIESNSNDTKFIELNDIITEGILSAHQVNDPALFGVAKNTGLFVNQSQILNSLEIFRTQYIKPKQKFIEKVFNRLARINGISDNLELAQYELNFAKMDLSISDVLSIINSTQAPEVKRNMLVINGYSESDALKLVPENTPTPSTTTDTTQLESVEVNDNLKKLSGREYQGLLRIIRQYNNGKITKEIATTLLKSGFGLTDEEILSILNESENLEDKKTIL